MSYKNSPIGKEERRVLENNFRLQGMGNDEIGMRISDIEKQVMDMTIMLSHPKAEQYGLTNFNLTSEEREKIYSKMIADSEREDSDMNEIYNMTRGVLMPSSRKLGKYFGTVVSEEDFAQCEVMEYQNLFEKLV